MSGTSPTHVLPFHWMPGRVGSHGLPLASAEARLYMTRRLAGHEKAHWWYMPRPSGSALLRRWARFPDSVYTPEWSQLPHSVEPSSWSWPKPSSCWPAVLSVLLLSLGSGMSARALPLISFKTSERSGLTGFVYAQETFKTGSGSAPPSFL